MPIYRYVYHWSPIFKQMYKINADGSLFSVLITSDLPPLLVRAPNRLFARGSTKYHKKGTAPLMSLRFLSANADDDAGSLEQSTRVTADF